MRRCVVLLQLLVWMPTWLFISAHCFGLCASLRTVLICLRPLPKKVEVQHFETEILQFSHINYSVCLSQLQNLDKKELSRLMLGPAGSKVSLSFQRKHQTKIETVTLWRGSDNDQQPVSSELSWRSEVVPMPSLFLIQGARGCLTLVIKGQCASQAFSLTHGPRLCIVCAHLRATALRAAGVARAGCQGWPRADFR